MGMTRDEVFDRLRAARREFDDKVSAIPEPALVAPIAGSPHSPKDIVAHVSAYDELIVERIRAARRGETTAFDRDRDSWEAFNERVWSEAEARDAATVLDRACRVFDDLLGEIGGLTDADLNEDTDLTRHIDPGWLQGRAMWELIAIDGYEHYPMHFAQLDAAFEAASGAPRQGSGG